ncbi:D-isomer specific 2-hydroxyacid dehydrogenase, NAD-binding domain [Dillenia turbinata]|uniref:D-isomer specific 2-hydroxyacid dehydrogenase, NAD-binding domain n=1 Tax=Dillenia turbinata TaxID=194707 RepID=A0AAN8ZWH1_9MAGN
MDTLNDLLAASDLISQHCASTNETVQIINTECLQHIKPGPIMTKFTIAWKVVGTYKEVLRSQVEYMLNDRLLHFVDIDLHDVKICANYFSCYTSFG